MFSRKENSHFHDDTTDWVTHDKPEINNQGKGFHKTAEVTHLKPGFNVRDEWWEADHVVKHEHNQDFIGELHSSFEWRLKVICFSDDYDCGNDWHCFEEYLHPQEVFEDHHNYCHQKSSEHEVERVNKHAWTFVKR